MESVGKYIFKNDVKLKLLNKVSKNFNNKLINIEIIGVPYFLRHYGILWRPIPLYRKVNIEITPYLKIAPR